MIKYNNLQKYKCSKCGVEFYGEKDNHPQKCPNCPNIYCLDKINDKGLL